MIVSCDKCSLRYDDIYRQTYCPHDSFDMHTKVFRGNEEKCCHSIEELNQFMDKE